MKKKKNYEKKIRKIVQNEHKKLHPFRFEAKINRRKLFDEIVDAERDLGKNPYKLEGGEEVNRKEKMVQIYEAMADMTLDVINFLKDSEKKDSAVSLDEYVLEMVRTTQSLYETINHANQPVIATASVLDVSGE